MWKCAKVYNGAQYSNLAYIAGTTEISNIGIADW